MIGADEGFRPIGRLHHILVVDGFGLPTKLPSVIEENVSAMRRLYPDAQYRLWDGKSIRELISSEFDASVSDAFETLRPYTYKADLAKYCILYLFGGLYADLDVQFLNPMRIPSQQGIASFRDVDLHSPSWVAVIPKIVWATPGRREFRIAIDNIVENCRDRFYGENALYPTGPVLFGHAMIAALTEHGQHFATAGQWIGSARQVTPEHPRKNIVFVAPDHSLTALSVKRTGGDDLVNLGLGGTNNYNVFWRMKKVYGEQCSLWSFADPAIKLTHRAARTSSGIAAVGDEPGHLTFGPYIELEPGHYRIVLTFEGAILLPTMTIDVTYDCGERLTAVVIDPGPRPSPFEATVDFKTERQLRDVEFRTDIQGQMVGHITNFRLESLDSAPTRGATGP